MQQCLIYMTCSLSSKATMPYITMDARYCQYDL